MTFKPVTNKHCLNKGHTWKPKLDGWVCDHCRMLVQYSDRFTTVRSPSTKYRFPKDK